MGVSDCTSLHRHTTNNKKTLHKPTMGKKDLKKKSKKSTSNVFSQFEQQQIQEFKEAFQMIDADRNGIITVGDLKATYASLGVRNIDQDELEKMTCEAGAPINFTIFLSMLADKLHGTVHKDYIAQVLKTNADRFNEEEINQMFSLCAPNEEGQFDYKALCYTLTHGADPDEEGDE